MTTVKHLFKFCMELDGISSTSFQVFDYADLKGKRQRNLKPFYFAWLNLRLPPRLHVTRARPYQGGSWECWGPPWISTFWNLKYLLRIYLCYILTYRHTYKFTCVNSPSTLYTKDLLRCCSATLQELTEHDTGWIKADQLVGMPLFKLSLYCFQTSRTLVLSTGATYP